MTTIEQNEAAALRCIDLFNKCNSDWVDICYAKEAQWIEHPHLGNPRGRIGNREALHQASEWLISYFPDRQLTVTSHIAQGNMVVLEQDWQGTTAKQFGDRPAGTIIKQRIASFFTFDDNTMIIKQEDYVASIFP